VKKILIFLFLAGVFYFFAHAQQWISFSSLVPSAPEVNLLTSNTQTVSFEVTIPGIYRLDTIVNGITFSRLYLSDGYAINPVGYPEIPVISFKIAIPHCDNVEVETTIKSQQNMTFRWVYPVPETVKEQNEQGNPVLVEYFNFNANAYTQPRSPEPVSVVSSHGALRKQHYVEITIAPIVFCPVTQQLSVIDKVEVILDFKNPLGKLQQDVGIFNKPATSAFINYTDDGVSASLYDKAFEKERFTPGSVTWRTITHHNQAKYIEADYVIICAPAFFEPNNPDSELLRFAEYRAWYNGFDVVILNVEHILSDAVGFPYEGTPLNPNNTTFKKEQRIRTCIRYIYEGLIYPVPEDPRLKYVLLVGDIELKEDDDGFGMENPMGCLFHMNMAMAFPITIILV
jgi:hypothetical protein